MCFWLFAWVPYHLIQAPEHKKTDQRTICGRCEASFAKSGTWAYWTGAAEIVRIELHAQPYCVTTTGFHNKVSTVPESPWPEVSVSQKFEIQIQIFNRFFCNCFFNVFTVENVVRKHLKFEIRFWKMIGPTATILWPYNFFCFGINGFLNALCFAKRRMLFNDFPYMGLYNDYDY